MWFGPVRARVVQSGQDARLQRFHLRCLVGVDVIVAEQVQGAVNQHVGPVRLQGLVLFGCFADHDLGAHHDIAQQRQFQFGRQVAGE